MNYYAHTRDDTPKEQWQRLVDHLTQTADLAGEFAARFRAKELGYTIGLLHDIGKYSQAFQQRLEGARRQVDHSTPGLQEVMDIYQKSSKSFAKIISYIIGGHHTGLPDAGSENYEGSFENRRVRSVEDCSAYSSEITPPDLSDFKFPIKSAGDPAFSLYFFIKMLYSCLVDADFLDTERYMNVVQANYRGQYDSFDKLLYFFNLHMGKIASEAKITKLNEYRSKILENCISKSSDEPGFFSLTVPTGGGKTLSSMAFALNHAVKHGMERIIYVIPYTSIIEQNAEVFRKIFGETNVLEHHSNFLFETDEYTVEVSKKLQLASENWDIPIIITTNVQFFESLFANRSSKSRKIHNLAKSIIILDEAQMLPVKYLKISLLALSELAKNYSSSVVLCTATQPNLNSLLPKDLKIREIIESPDALYQNLRRTQIKNLGEMDDDTLIDQLQQYPQVLCIVNTREHARQLYERLVTSSFGDSPEGIYHLSTRMCPLDRRKVLEKIRSRLKTRENGEVLECKVVSTQLIEAGVDVDFPTVFRSLAGIDSIAQAAGRCNREGGNPCADVFVFSSTEKHGQPPREIEINVSQAKSVLRNYTDPLSLDAISKYFELLYDMKNIDQKEILKEIHERAKWCDFPFVEIAHRYKLIETVTIPVIIPADDNCRDLIVQLQYPGPIYKRVRQLQPYIVNIYKYEFDKLFETGGISVIDSEKGFYQLSDYEKYYNQQTGIVRERDDLLLDLLII